MIAILKNIVVFEDRLQWAGSYWKYLSETFELHLYNYLPVFEKHRESIGLIPSPEDWKALPFGKFAENNYWKWRRESFTLAQRIIGESTYKTTLEIGPWNGWLTKYLASKSDCVVAADYFTQPFDGIGNIATLHKNIIPIQCNVARIATEFQPNVFELIVLNHNLNYMDAPTDYIQNLVPLLKPNGKIISLGNTVYKNPEVKKRSNAIMSQEYYEKYQTDLYIQPVKGFLDSNDIQHLKNAGFKTIKYPGKWLQNAYSKINKSAPEYLAITYQNR